MKLLKIQNAIVASLLAVMLFSCTENKVKKSIEVKQYTIDQFMDNEDVNGGSFSHNNSKMLISSNQSGIFNLYTIPTKGGDLTALTFSDSTSIYGESFFPDDDRILFSADGNGDEIYHLFVRELDGSIRDITPFSGAKASFSGWSKDRQFLYYSSNKRDPRFFDVYKMSINDYSEELIYQNKSGLNFSHISDDENFLSLSLPISSNNGDLFIYNVKTDEMTKVNDNLSANSSHGFSLDNNTFYYTTDENGEFKYLMSYDLKSKEKKKLIEKSWDIVGSGFTSNGKYMVVYTNEDGKNVIDLLDGITLKPVELLPDFENKSITSVKFSRNEQWVRMYVGGSNSPDDLYSYDLLNNKQYKLTNVLNENIDASHLVKAEVIRYKSFDGTEIPAIYYLPHQATEKNNVPALVWVHGGPGGQSYQNYNSLIQYVVNNGYAVLAVNNRGSSGYGKTFFEMDDRNHGEKDLQDCIEGKKWLAQQIEINENKIGIIGGSYGGYMTMAALSFTPNEFAVGVNMFGVTNWIRTLKSIPPYWEAYRKVLYAELGDPFTEDSVRLKRISPLFHADNVTKPLMVLQGAQDPRVL